MPSHYLRKAWLVVLLALALLLGMVPAVVGAQPQDPLLYAFVANAEEASVSKVDLVNNIEVARYSTILDRTGGTDAWNDCRVSRLTMDPAGNAWALNSMTGSGVNYATQQGQVIRISARPVAGEAPGVTTSNTGGLAGIVIPDIRVSIFNVGALADLPRTINVIEDSGHTYLWIGFYGGGYYQKYEYTGTELVAVGAKVLLPTGFRPYTSAITEEGILWGASRNANPYGPTTTVGVFKFDINGPPVTATSMPYDPPGGNNPYFTYVMDNGDVWISDGDWNSSTKEFAVYPAGGGGPLYYNAGTYTAMRGFTEVAGDVWATTINGQVLKGEWNGATWVWTVAVTGLGELTGVAMDPEGYLWAVSYGTDRLYKFDPDDPNNGIWVGVGDGPYAYGDFVAPPLPAALGDYVWYDTNMNGIQDVGELGVPDVTVNLMNSAGTVIDTTTTDADGYYLFGDLAAGDYKVQFVLPSGYMFTSQDAGANDAIDSDANTTTGITVLTTLVAGETDLTWDAGIYELACIGDFVWEDMDADGIQDVNEMGIPGVTVNLYDSADALIATTTTDANGEYLFCGLVPGDYQVGFELPATYVFSPQDQGGDDALDSDADVTTGLTAVTTLTPGEYDMTWDAGMFRNASKSGYKWHDLNGDGVRDDNEPLLEGWTIQVRDLAGGLIASDITDGSGAYQLWLTPGSYVVSEVLQPGWIQTYPAGGVHNITLVSGERDVDNNFGNWLPQPSLEIKKTGDELSKIGDKVYYTITVKNTSPAGSPDMVIRITDPILVIDTTVTLASGAIHEIKDVEFTIPADAADPFPNTAYAKGYFDGYPTYTAEGESTWKVNLFQPGVEITKTGDRLSKVGDEITYVVTITNTSSEDAPPLILKSFSDSLVPGATVPVEGAVLDYKESVEFKYTYTPKEGDPDQLVNVAEVHYYPEGFDNDIWAKDDHTVNLFQPGVEITKTGDRLSKVGDEITYVVTITNTSSTDSPDLILDTFTDSLVDEATITIPDAAKRLAPGATATITYTYMVTKADDPDWETAMTWTKLYNEAYVLYHPEGFPNKIEDTDDHVVWLVHPRIDITKDSDPDCWAREGDYVDWTIEITNTGDVGLKLVSVVDTLKGNITSNFDSWLDAGESDSYTYSRLLTSTDPSPLKNHVVVHANPYDAVDDVWVRLTNDIMDFADDYICKLKEETAWFYDPGNYHTNNTYPGIKDKNWGWYNGPYTVEQMKDGVEFDIYAAAGGNDISKGYLVGTARVTLAVDAMSATITIDMAEPAEVGLIHAWIGNTGLPVKTVVTKKKTTTTPTNDPGQFPYNSGYLDYGTIHYEYTVNFATPLTAPVYVSVHIESWIPVGECPCDPGCWPYLCEDYLNQ